jgi:bleomycin hydrolase
MGANQSKTPLPNEKLVIERLQAMELNDQDNEYIQVDEKAIAEANKSFKAPWTALSASDVAEWEHQLLQDPKNR